MRKILEIVQQLVDNKIAKGHILGPFDEPPLPDMVFSPLNIIPKAGSEGEYQLIHDLAYPYNSQSLNSCIPQEEASVQYRYLEDVINMAMEIGTSAWGARIDVKHAFRNLPIHFDDLQLLGFTLNNKYYINSTLPFGASSSCAIFERVSTALQWIIANETQKLWISHFLDDFPLLEQS